MEMRLQVESFHSLFLYAWLVVYTQSVLPTKYMYCTHPNLCYLVDVDPSHDDFHSNWSNLEMSFHLDLWWDHAFLIAIGIPLSFIVFDFLFFFKIWDVFQILEKYYILFMLMIPNFGISLSLFFSFLIGYVLASLRKFRMYYFLNLHAKLGSRNVCYRDLESESWQGGPNCGKWVSF